MLNSNRMRRKLQAEAEIARLVQAIAEGQPSQSLVAAVGERERELRTITDRLLEPRPDSLQLALGELRTFAVSRSTNIRELIEDRDSVDQARAALAEHFGKFTLEPTMRESKATYVVYGKVDFFWDERWRERVVPARLEHSGLLTRFRIEVAA